MTARPSEDEASPTDPTGAPAASARDLVRRRTRTYRAPETGRHHHIGAAPERQPVLGEQGTSYVGTAAVQLAARTPAQLRVQRDRLRDDMAAAAADLQFERAAALRDELVRVEAELAARPQTDPSAG